MPEQKNTFIVPTSIITEIYEQRSELLLERCSQTFPNWGMESLKQLQMQSEII